VQTDWQSNAVSMLSQFTATMLANSKPSPPTRNAAFVLNCLI